MRTRRSRGSTAIGPLAVIGALGVAGALLLSAVPTMREADGTAGYTPSSEQHGPARHDDDPSTPGTSPFGYAGVGNWDWWSRYSAHNLLQPLLEQETPGGRRSGAPGYAVPLSTLREIGASSGAATYGIGTSPY